MCCSAAVTYMGVDSNCSFLYPWLDLRLSASASWTKPTVAVELELGFWCKQTAHYEFVSSIMTWFWDCRCFCHWQQLNKPTFSCFCWIGARFWCKTNSSLWGLSSLFQTFWTVIPTMVNKQSLWFSDVICSAVTYMNKTLFSFRWIELGCQVLYPSTIWDCRTASWTKPFFRFWLNWGFWCKQTAHIMRIRRFLCLETVILTIVHPSLWYFWWCVVKRSRTWALINNRSFVHPWLDLRLSVPLPEQNPFFVSELELGLM